MAHKKRGNNQAEQMVKLAAPGFERFLFFCFLRHDMNVHGRRLAQEAVHG